MYEMIAVGVYLLLAVAIAVGIIALFQKRSVEEPISQGHSGRLAPLAALAAIAEEAHRHSRPDLSALPWTPASALAPGEDDGLTLTKLSERLHVVEARLDHIAGGQETSFTRTRDAVRLS